MNFYLNWRRNYTWSKLEACFLLSKYQSSSYDHAQFLCQLRLKLVQYVILKLLSIVKRDAKGQRMLAFLRSKTALCKWDIQYIKPALSKQKFSSLYLNCFFSQVRNFCNPVHFVYLNYLSQEFKHLYLIKKVIFLLEKDFRSM